MTDDPAEIAPEAGDGIRRAQLALEREAERLEAVDDPGASYVRAQATMAAAQNRLVVDAALKSAAMLAQMGLLIRESRKPWTAEEMGALIQQLDRMLLKRWVQFNRAGIALGVAFALALALAGGAAGYYGRGEVPSIAGVRAGADRCQDRADGSRLCWIPVFERQAPAAKP